MIQKENLLMEKSILSETDFNNLLQQLPPECRCKVDDNVVESIVGSMFKEIDRVINELRQSHPEEFE